MNSYDVKRLILASALEAEMQGMISANKEREMNGCSMAYNDADFQMIADQMRELANKHDGQL